MDTITTDATMAAVVVRISDAKAPEASRKAASKDNRIVELHDYPNGWVNNSYKWRCPGTRRTFRRNGAGHWVHTANTAIDRKCHGGNGPEWVAVSEAGGRIASAR